MYSLWIPNTKWLKTMCSLLNGWHSVRVHDCTSAQNNHKNYTLITRQHLSQYYLNKFKKNIYCIFPIFLTWPKLHFPTFLWPDGWVNHQTHVVPMILSRQFLADKMFWQKWKITVKGKFLTFRKLRKPPAQPMCAHPLHLIKPSLG